MPESVVEGGYDKDKAKIDPADLEEVTESGARAGAEERGTLRNVEAEGWRATDQQDSQDGREWGGRRLVSDQ